MAQVRDNGWLKGSQRCLPSLVGLTGLKRICGVPFQVSPDGYGVVRFVVVEGLGSAGALFRVCSSTSFMQVLLASAQAM